MTQVSVIIPTYNTSRYIAETLDSVFAQTFKDYEVIVINDGSPDTLELEKALQPYRDRILYLKQENRGPSGARNLGIRHARGKYVAFLDSDDRWFPDYLESQMKVLEGPDMPDVVYSDCLQAGDGLAVPHRVMERNPTKPAPTFESLLLEECVAPTSATIGRREALVNAGLFDENLRRVEDYDLWLRVAYFGGKVRYQRKVLAVHRVRADSLSADAVRMRECHLRVLEKLDKTLALSQETRSLLCRQIALVQANLELAKGKNCLAVGRYTEAREHLSAANAYFQSFKLSIAVGLLCYAPGLVPAVVRTWGSFLCAYNAVRGLLRKPRQDLTWPLLAVADRTSPSGNGRQRKGCG